MAESSPSETPTRTPRHASTPAMGPVNATDVHPSISDDGESSSSQRHSADDIHSLLDENSPLLSPNAEGDDDESQKSRSVWYLIMLTIGIGGLQVAWSVELSNGSPYLLSLGMSKSLMALVWIAAPLTGTLVQPYVGMLSDNCRLPWGKRKPFLLGGTAATIVSLMCLAWTKEIIGSILTALGADPESSGVRVSIIVAAVIGIYVLDFGINTVQAMIRAFIVDCAPAHQQEAANAMASRITGVGNIIGYVAGYVNLLDFLWFFGKTQFQVLCVIASIGLASTVVLSTTLIKERDPRNDGPPPPDQPGVFRFFLTIFKSIRRLPPQVLKVCQVQFCAWAGFFPLLFYTSSYIGEIYVEPYLQENPHLTPAELDKLYEQATRIGTFALLVNSIVSLLTNLFMPFFIAPTYDTEPLVTNAPGENSTSFLLDKERHRTFLDRLRIPGFTLKRAWFGSLILFAFAMFCTVLVRSVQAATALIGLAGITWAMTLWAPWAIISAEISRRDALLRGRKLRAARVANSGAAFDRGQVSSSREGAMLAQDGASEDEENDQAGVILGIHNMAIAAPQIMANVGSSIIFKIWQKPRGTPGDHSFAIVLALGGICVLASSFFVLRIKDDVSAVEDTVADIEGGGERGDAYGAGSDPTRPVMRSRKSSMNNAPRVSQDRAMLTRSRSFGGAEMI